MAYGDDLDDEDNEFLSGGDDDDGDDLTVVSGVQLDGLLDRVNSRKVPDLVAMRTLARARFPQSQTQLKPKLIATLGRLKRISAGMAAAAGKQEADRLRQPNMHCGIYGANLTPATSADFSITPSGGTSWWRFLGIIFTKGQVEKIGFKSLKIGGYEHIQAVQVQGSPVTGAVPAAGFVVGDNTNSFNINSWTGSIFDNTTPLTMTLVNMTTPGAGDAETVAPRCNIPAQIDPCGQRYSNTKVVTAQFARQFKRALAGFGGQLR